MDFRAAPRFARVRQTERVESYAIGLKAREVSKGEKSESLADFESFASLDGLWGQRLGRAGLETWSRWSRYGVPVHHQEINPVGPTQRHNERIMGRPTSAKSLLVCSHDHGVEPASPGF